jgi:hypothetical protein
MDEYESLAALSGSQLKAPGFAGGYLQVMTGLASCAPQ